MKKKFLAAGILILCICGISKTRAEEETVQLTVPILFERGIPKDIKQVKEAVKELVKEKIGVEVQLVEILYNTSSSSQDQRQKSELKLLEKQGILFDIFPTVLYKEGFLPLNDLLEQYGKDIVDFIGEERMEFSKEDGIIWTVPSVSDYVSSFGITMRADFLSESGIHTEEIKTIADLDQVFETIKEKNPQIAMVCGYRTRRGFIDRLKAARILIEPICAREEDSDKLVNYYATEEYKEMVTMFYQWGEKGYLPDALPLQNLMGSALVEGENLFSYFSPCKPSIEYEESISCGMDMITIPLMEPIVTEYSLESTVHWGISQKCEHPKEAMEFLNLMYTDSELVNLMIYGIEGIHYEIQGDGTIDYPEGVDRKNVGYQNTQPWFLPNQLISYVWNGNDPLVWEKTRLFNEEAKWQESLFFDFETEDISEEIEKLEEIIEKYTYGLESGQLNPDIYLPMMLEEMEKAGAERVVEEVQKQWDADF